LIFLNHREHREHRDTFIFWFAGRRLQTKTNQPWRALS